MIPIRSAVWRAVRTALQTFLALLIASGPLDQLSVSTLKSAGIAAGAAVIALVMRWLDGTDFPTPPAD